MKYTMHNLGDTKMHARMVAHVEYSRSLRLRMAAAWMLMKLAARVLGCEIEVVTETRG